LLGKKGKEVKEEKNWKKEYEALYNDVLALYDRYVTQAGEILDSAEIITDLGEILERR